MKQKIVGKTMVSAQARIVYEKLEQKKIELGSQLLIKASIEVFDKMDIMYVIDGGKSWAIVGINRGKVNAREGTTNVTVQGIPVQYGKLPIPQIKLEATGERRELIIERSGDAQIVSVCPKAIVIGIPKNVNMGN